MTDSPTFPGVVASQAMSTVLRQAEQVAGLPRPVMIRGERGTGKELLARYIHACSPRASAPFVAINCAAVSDQLVNAELFGHERGAFTGADEKRVGKLELADGGTLFLDEIGTMSPAFQERILRVVEYQTFQRVRGTEDIAVDVRILSATNADIAALMGDGVFRRDLYDRLAFAAIEMPPLRRRREAIPHLVVHIVQALQREMPNLPVRRFTREAIAAMMEYYWPGNVRELRNVVERVYCYSAGESITPAELPPEIAGTKIVAESFHGKVEAYKRQLIEEALRAAGNNQRGAARQLQMSYDQFRHYYRKLRGESS